MPVSEVFVSIPDPRSQAHAKHDLSELLTVAVCAVLCGGRTTSSMWRCGANRT
jgi:hypothetical protein